MILSYLRRKPKNELMLSTQFRLSINLDFLNAIFNVKHRTVFGNFKQIGRIILAQQSQFPEKITNEQNGGSFLLYY
ncbi:unnamed protein product, partial [Wuchereria bancrofti]